MLFDRRKKSKFTNIHSLPKSLSVFQPDRQFDYLTNQARKCKNSCYIIEIYCILDHANILHENEICKWLPVRRILEDAFGGMVLNTGPAVDRQREPQAQRVRLQTFQFGIESDTVGRHVDVVDARRRVASRRRR